MRLRHWVTGAALVAAPFLVGGSAAWAASTPASESVSSVVATPTVSEGSASGVDAPGGANLNVQSGPNVHSGPNVQVGSTTGVDTLGTAS